MPEEFPKCPRCGQTFSRPDALVRHAKTHLRKEEFEPKPEPTPEPTSEPKPTVLISSIPHHAQRRVRRERSESIGPSESSVSSGANNWNIVILAVGIVGLAAVALWISKPSIPSVSTDSPFDLVGALQGQFTNISAFSGD
jgi:uncharacterized Zn-finger protein